MSKTLQIIARGCCKANDNMDLDARLLKNMGDEVVLHFYEFAGKSATFGIFLNPFEYLRPHKALIHGLDVARRPTGGGVLFHMHDFTFSLLLPSCHPLYTSNVLQAYACINDCVAGALKEFLPSHCDLLQNEPQAGGSSRRFCMAKPTRYDVMLGGKKIGGAAQRQTQKGLLHQGSISLISPDWLFLQDIVKDAQVVQDMQRNSAYLLPASAGNMALRDVRDGLRAALQRHFLAVFS